MSTSKFLFIAFFIQFVSTYTLAQDDWSAEQQEIIAAIHKLSATTAPDGAGADAYGQYLADDFSRWTVGSEMLNNKTDWVEGIREWFNDGWRVSDRQQQILEIDIVGNMAHLRRIVSETYLGPDGDVSSSKAALAEVWAKRDNQWLLYKVNVHPIPNK
ncbi:nuclear transport factor 2 family protein [Fulvivirga sp. RKSG066]|uniref:nuclear transport factor 2 family protein n=1 Tax=Fulvivirga aurantia TaxID=2529383 RepID=UPI0012BBF13B|nr:nuclear transport factor 2 family protein [Fulvivirga aurantia]MTI20779.1 nuclear transport factor 2 family protein [Fulvivirga aurantia]